MCARRHCAHRPTVSEAPAPVVGRVTRSPPLRNIGEVMLRSLDAIDLASALAIRADLSTFIAYDHLLGGGASAAGLELLAPGRDDLGRPPGI